MERRARGMGQVKENGDQTVRKICGLGKRGASLEIPRNVRPVSQIVQSPSEGQMMFSEPQVKSEIASPCCLHGTASQENISGEKFQRQQMMFKSVPNAGRKSEDNPLRYKQAAVKVRSEDAVPTFTQKFNLAHRRRLGMAKQWSMDETQSWFRQEIRFFIKYKRSFFKY